MDSEWPREDDLIVVHVPCRGSDVETWIKRWRERHRGTNHLYSGAWWAIDKMLDDYREHAATGTFLFVDVEDPHAAG